MNNSDSLCVFASQNSRHLYACMAIEIKECDGLNKDCKFFKTEDMFNAEKDKAIERCRKKGLCNDCKYSARSCVKSDETL